ncbi:MFS transporter, partial [Pseudomonas syringae]
GPGPGALRGIEGRNVHGGQWRFRIAGCASIVLCGFVWCWLQSHPHEARWLSDEEKTALSTAIAEEQRQREAAQTVRPSVLRLLADRQILLFCFIYFAVALTLSGATFWLPSMIRKMGSFSDFELGLLDSIPWIISIVAMYGFAALAARFK